MGEFKNKLKDRDKKQIVTSFLNQKLKLVQSPTDIHIEDDHFQSPYSLNLPVINPQRFNNTSLNSPRIRKTNTYVSNEPLYRQDMKDYRSSLLDKDRGIKGYDCQVQQPIDSHKKK